MTSCFGWVLGALQGAFCGLGGLDRVLGFRIRGDRVLGFRIRGPR